MAVVIDSENKNQLKIYINIDGMAEKPPIKLILDMSLQRHCYRRIADAESKGQNSVMHDLVTDAAIIADAKDVGSQVEKAVLHGVNPAGLSTGRDYTVATKRVYRVDSSNEKPPPNHFYPISGPGIWSNIDKQTFSAISHFRNLEVLLLEKFSDTLPSKDLYKFYVEVRSEKQRISQRAAGLNMHDDLRTAANERMKRLIDCMDNHNLNTVFNTLSDETKSLIVQCAGDKPWHKSILRFLSDFARSKAGMT